MVAIPDEKVQEVKDKVDIVDLVGRYVELRRAGANYKGLCPFHGERTPSFNVNPARKGWKCFGCGQGGDAIRFVMEIEGKSFVEAVRKLGELYGVSMPAEGRNAAAKRSEKDEAYALCKLATQTWQAILASGPEGEAGRAYVRTRGLDPEVVEAFRLGYAPAPAEAGWDRLARTIAEHKLSLPLAEGLGLVGRSEKSGQWFDRFRGRLVFPVVAPGGEAIAFSARIVPPHDDVAENPPPKYYNSPESLLFTKGKMLFGLHQARVALAATRRAVLVEGNLDVVRMHQWGLREAVAPLGTALTAEQARLLARFCDQVVMAFDGDAAGRKAAWAALPLLLEADLDVRMVLLPDGQDPDSIGPERLGALLARPEAALVQMMQRMKEKAGSAVDARAKALDRILPLVLKAPRESQRDLYADRAAELFELPRTRVEARLRALAKAGDAGATDGLQGRRGPSQGHASRPSSSAGASRGPQENSREIGSTTPGPVTLSAAVRPSLPLPAGQSDLTMLLVDVPHLASVAERQGALQWIEDVRLSPIARAVVDGARRGDDLSMPELLALVDAEVQPQVHDAVFAGRYRNLGERDPQALLAELLRSCEIESLRARKERLRAEANRLLAQGFDEQGRALHLEAEQMRQRIDALRNATA
ncbi:MAG: DNA primase [Nannocystaceae bacterium]|nr:DNA primase [Nannocystaceae bacterium]